MRRQAPLPCSPSSRLPKKSLPSSRQKRKSRRKKRESRQKSRRKKSDLLPKRSSSAKSRQRKRNAYAAKRNSSAKPSVPTKSNSKKKHVARESSRERQIPFSQAQLVLSRTGSYAAFSALFPVNADLAIPDDNEKNNEDDNGDYSHDDDAARFR